jgi:hypothetical protein
MPPLPSSAQGQHGPSNIDKRTAVACSCNQCHPLTRSQSRWEPSWAAVCACPLLPGPWRCADFLCSCWCHHGLCLWYVCRATSVRSHTTNIKRSRHGQHLPIRRRPERYHANAGTVHGGFRRDLWVHSLPKCSVKRSGWLTSVQVLHVHRQRDPIRLGVSCHDGAVSQPPEAAVHRRAPYELPSVVGAAFSKMPYQTCRNRSCTSSPRASPQTVAAASRGRCLAHRPPRRMCILGRCKKEHHDWTISEKKRECLHIAS